jgi:hypothetical protein
MGKGLPTSKRTPNTIVAKSLSVTTRQQPVEFDLALDMGSVLDFSLLGKVRAGSSPWD